MGQTGPRCAVRSETVLCTHPEMCRESLHDLMGDFAPCHDRECDEGGSSNREDALNDKGVF